MQFDPWLFVTSNFTFGPSVNERVLRDLVQSVVLVVQHHDLLVHWFKPGFHWDLLRLQLLPGSFLLIQLLFQFLDWKDKTNRSVCVWFWKTNTNLGIRHHWLKCLAASFFFLRAAVQPGPPPPQVGTPGRGRTPPAPAFWLPDGIASPQPLHTAQSLPGAAPGASYSGCATSGRVEQSKVFPPTPECMGVFTTQNVVHRVTGMATCCCTLSISLILSSASSWFSFTLTNSSSLASISSSCRVTWSRGFTWKPQNNSSVIK